MKKYIPIIISVTVMIAIGYVVVGKKNSENTKNHQIQNIGTFTKKQACARPPQFLKKINIPQPVMIDLSQKGFKGIALHHGQDFSKTLHPKIWEQYEHFSTYALDAEGNLYLVPTPFISIRPTTFNLQKNIYKLDTHTGKLSIFMHFEDVHPSANNPYGINAIAYDCEDKTLWVAAIDESNYASQKGIIYHVNPQTKEILQKIDGFDVLTMGIINSKKGKYLLVGSARDNALYAYGFKDGKLNQTPQKLLEIPSPNEYIRKIKIKGDNHLELQTMPFSYTLIAQTAKKDRTFYDALWDDAFQIWTVEKQ